MTLVIIGGWVYVIGGCDKNEADNKIAKPVNQATENYYDFLEKKCAGDNCCISSLETMRDNNYKEADENGKCPEGFYMDMMKCVTSYQWCVPMEEIEWENCEQDFDCEARFSHCDCYYHCVNRREIISDCDAFCYAIPTVVPECVCENNKCVNKKEDTSYWQTYRNEEFGFEVGYPKEEIKISVNDNIYPLGLRIVFPSNLFSIIIDANYKGNILDYQYMSVSPQKIAKDNFQVYSLQDSSVPFIAFVKKFNSKVYIIEFQGDIELDFNESQILSTFKFTN